MQNDKIDLQVEVNGRPVRVFSHEGKSFIESRESVEYSLRVKNKTAGRVLAIISVDGINIVSGNPVSDKPSEAGYVLGPKEEQVIKGYRVDENTVAQFKFVKRGDSYATERGDGQGNGVIAVRVFERKESDNERTEKILKMLQDWKRDEEKKEVMRDPIYIPYPVYPRPVYPNTYPWWYTSPYIYCGSDIKWNEQAPIIGTISSTNGIITANCCVNSSENSQWSFTSSVEASQQSNPFSHGSSWGSAVKDTIKEVEFEPGNLLAELVIYYAPIEGLKSLGVNVTREKEVAFPEPFKREYCAPPKGWKPSS